MGGFKTRDIKKEVLQFKKRVAEDGGTDDICSKNVLDVLPKMCDANKTSLTMIPIAYKEGTLYSQKPVETLGDELVVNGGFDTDSDWTIESSWEISGGKANVINPTNTNLYQLVSINTGSYYKVEFDVTNSNNGKLLVYFGAIVTEEISNCTNGRYTINGVFITNGNIIFRNNGFVGSIDNVSVKQIFNGDFTVERNSIATRVNKEGLIEEVGVNVPRIDYSDGEPTLLVEPQRENLYLNSDVLVTQNVNTLLEDYTVSFYGTGTINFTGSYVGSLVGTGVNERVSVTFSATVGVLISTVSGSVNKAQIEQGSYPTSYIPTNGTTVVRQADIIKDAGDVTTFNSEEGVLFVEMAALEETPVMTVYISISDETYTNRLGLLYTAGGNNIIRSFMYVGGVKQFDIFGLATIKDYNKVAIKYKENECQLYINGVKVAEDLMAETLPINTLSKLALTEINTTTGRFEGKIKQLKVFNTALTDAELIKLTTP